MVRIIFLIMGQLRINYQAVHTLSNKDSSQPPKGALRIIHVFNNLKNKKLRLSRFLFVPLQPNTYFYIR